MGRGLHSAFRAAALPDVAGLIPDPLPAHAAEMKPRILIVEDEPSILDNITYSLETEGFEPHGCATGADARAALQLSLIHI